jgi:glycosyltransferase involved in cell wall biosynthesis
MHCHVVNLQRHLLGAEVYTLFFMRALQAAGCDATLYVHPGARHWESLATDGIRVVPVAADTDIAPRLSQRAWVLTHAPVSAGFMAQMRGTHLLTGFCHMPLAGRSAGHLEQYDLVYAVSRHALATLPGAGVSHAYPEPMYGVADFGRFGAPADQRVRAGAVYSSDGRKWRDRLLTWLEPVSLALRPARYFERAPGVTLGLVSGIGPIKQFEKLFGIIAPVLAARPAVHLEVFGYGGYRSVADLRQALAPLGARARFWGRQRHPELVYPQLDWLMSGLPEKEALGLNIIEAQMLGTPVLAIDAPPFTETVADGSSGILYPDPRSDNGAGFARALDRALAAPRPDPRMAIDHLARFSQQAFNGRVARLVADAATRL